MGGEWGDRAWSAHKGLVWLSYNGEKREEIGRRDIRERESERQT